MTIHLDDEVQGLEGEFGAKRQTLLPSDILSSEPEIRRKLEQLQSRSESAAELLEFIRDNELEPFITHSKLRDPIALLIDIDAGLERMRFYLLPEGLSDEELNGDVDAALSERNKVLLHEVDDPRLIFSSFELGKAESASAREMAAQLFTLGRRISRYDGVSVIWDQNVDRKVWTTNIDTVSILKTLAADGLFERDDVKSMIELGVGGGGISKYCLQNCQQLEHLVATDISPYALMCARRNFRPVVSESQELEFFLGKGLKTLDRTADVIVVNPPYIPHPEGYSDTDPYRGTGLIKEILEEGLNFLNPDNPDACIYMGVSSLASADIEKYLENCPDLEVKELPGGLEVPLKILAINENSEWTRFLIEDCGLAHHPERVESTGFAYWHNISVLKITRRS